MMPYAEHKELIVLLGGLCSEDLDDAGKARLDAILLENPKARQIYRRYLNLHASLKQYHVGNDVKSTCSTTPSPILGFLGDSARQALDFCMKSTPFAILVAIGFPVLCVIALSIQVYRHEMDSDTARVVATLSRAYDCNWGEVSRQPVSGEHLEANRRLDLQQGLAELTFTSGATVILEGPATLDLTSTQYIKLDSGKLTAKVPKQAVGFTVETPDSLIVDLGTEFGVIADATGRSETEVFLGQVEVGFPIVDKKASSTAPKKSFMPRRITAGQTARINIRTKTVRIAAAEPEASRFVQQMPVSRSVSFQQGVAGYNATRATYIRNCVRGKGSNGACIEKEKDEPDNTNSNYGDAARLFTALKVSRNDGLPEQSRALISFGDIFGNRPDQIPPGATILSATLRLHTVKEQSSEAPERHTLHEVLVGWQEGRVTWANFNDGGWADRQYGAAEVTHFTPVRANAFYELNVTQSVERWSEGTPNHGWLLVSHGWDRAHFDSDDSAIAANRPQLVVQYKLSEK